MAVEVIGEDPSVLKEISCRGCGAKLRYGKSDVKERHGTDYSGGPDGEEYIECPRCAHRVIIRSW